MARLPSYYMSSMKTPSFLDFSHTILCQMITKHRERQVPRPSAFRPGTNILQLTERYFTSIIKSTPINPRPHKCHMCANIQLCQKKHQSTHKQCIDCGIVLCLPSFCAYIVTKLVLLKKQQARNPILYSNLLQIITISRGRKNKSIYKYAFIHVQTKIFLQ